MRNSTKLKLVLSAYDAQLTLDDDLCFLLVLTHRKSGEKAAFREKNFTRLMNHAAAYMKKQSSNSEETLHRDFLAD